MMEVIMVERIIIINVVRKSLFIQLYKTHVLLEIRSVCLNGPSIHLSPRFRVITQCWGRISGTWVLAISHGSGWRRYWLINGSLVSPFWLWFDPFLYRNIILRGKKEIVIAMNIVCIGYQSTNMFCSGKKLICWWKMQY